MATRQNFGCTGNDCCACCGVRHLLGAHADDDSEAAGHVLRVECRDQRHQLTRVHLVRHLHQPPQVRLTYLVCIRVQ